jgi:hypothetical protein
MTEKDDMILFLGIALAVYFMYKKSQSKSPVYFGGTEIKENPTIPPPNEPVKNPDKTTNEYPGETKINNVDPSEPPTVEETVKSGSRSTISTIKGATVGTLGTAAVVGSGMATFVMGKRILNHYRDRGYTTIV